MSTQLSLQLSDRMFASAQDYAKQHGYDTLQDFIRNIIRKQIFEDEELGGILTSKASEESLSKHWMTAEEDKAWAHLQKEI